MHAGSRPRVEKQLNEGRNTYEISNRRITSAPLLQGLPDNLCQCPHWGTVVKGSIHVTYADGTEETVKAGEVYYWPPGHTVRVDEDYEAIEFSPSGQMGELMNHLEAKLKG